MRGLLASTTVGLLMFATLSKSMADCSCDRMTVTANRKAVTLCSQTKMADPLDCKAVKTGPGTACPSAKFAYSCPTGPNSSNLKSKQPFQRFGFTVVSNFALGSDSKQCRTGQILQENISSSKNPGFESNPKINPTTLDEITLNGRNIVIDNDRTHRFPHLSEQYKNKNLYGGDNYSGNANSDVVYDKSYRGAVWFDNPDYQKANQKEAAKWQFYFIAIVQGSGAGQSCSCGFILDVDWPSNGKPNATIAADMTYSMNCGYNFP